MVTILLISLTALIASGLTFFSGFGLGTILMPVFALFFPVDMAIALTAVVHLLNNFFKLLLVGKKTNVRILFRFGIPSLLAAFAGAWVLGEMNSLQAIYTYRLWDKSFDVTAVKLIIGLLLLFFALFEVIPYLSKLSFHQHWLVPGGFISGFFGGLSGNQGALRTAFLARSELDKESFIATGVAIACLTDLSRLSVYASTIFGNIQSQMFPALLSATLSAFAGAFAGRYFLSKVTLKSLQYIVAASLALFAILLIAGIV